MKIILSRKGFDSGNGRVPSPIFPDGSLLTLPILDETSHVRFRDVESAKGTVGDIVEQLTNGKITGQEGIHLDPDLNPKSLSRLPDWRPAFGQTRSSQGHLAKQRIDLGDLFLFFGWFQQIENSQDGTWRYNRSCPSQHLIFGWLQVDEVVPLEKNTDLTDVLNSRPWLRDHPHVQPTFSHEKRHSPNTIYVASETLQFPGLTRRLPGGGIFPRFTDALLLTATGKYNSEKKRSVWALPRCFLANDGSPQLTYHTNPSRWTTHRERVVLQSVARGQEFVLDCDQHSGVIEWAGSLFQDL